MNYYSLVKATEKEGDITDKLKQLCTSFLIKVKKRFSVSGRTSYYIHILCHVPDLQKMLIKRHQSLILFSNQGIESSHSYDSFISERHLARAAMKRLGDDNNFYNMCLGNRSKLNRTE